ncbi:photosystem II biogenesis protein Psp29 [Prochlorococcus sp. MIT 1307]|uniref:photosystem II biogenesis protein Psp29 n=1 Tax=Prochlorococcus sp. MIT 1307 TaxID=3096219 RepID=UPI002A75201B|nr:photosystem II biogenesis protein Psp29 [Prochlorococcus sp. MIT 1307]
MNERKTIADSKKAFHNAFPYVIPPIYRRVTDELLVELNLLSHARDFQPGPIFALGLRKVYEAFTKGYRPQEHLSPLFEAICRSNGFNPTTLYDKSQETLEASKGNSLNDIKNWLKQQGNGAPEVLANDIKELSQGRNHYSRLTVIGLFTLLDQGITSEENKKESISKEIKIITEKFGYSVNRVERDLTQYSANLEKISQALELLKETIAYEKKKKETK